MKIDYLSDIHLDYYFSPKFKEVNEDHVRALFDPIFLNNRQDQVGDLLVIAGDLGHYNDQNIQILKIFQKVYYKYIVCVLGNHDYYLVDRESRDYYRRDSFYRASDMKKQISKLNNIYCLDGDVVNIDGINFGGAMGWYSDAYIKKYFSHLSQSTLNENWKRFMNDSRLIYTIENFDDLYNIEYAKLEKVSKECDVMISHINPSYKHQHISPKYHNDITNSYFTFDGDSLISDGSMTHWIFGHTHDQLEYQFNQVKVHCNPLGYPFESCYGNCIQIKSFEIDSK